MHTANCPPAPTMEKPPVDTDPLYAVPPDAALPPSWTELHTCYRPQRSCGQGYAFTRVCDSVNGGGWVSGQGEPPRAERTPAPEQTSPPNRHHLPVFSLTLARSPMASRSYRRASDFLNYSPGLASDILAERKSEKKEEKNFFLKNCFPKQPWYCSLPKTDLIMIIYNI